MPSEVNEFVHYIVKQFIFKGFRDGTTNVYYDNGLYVLARHATYYIWGREVSHSQYGSRYRFSIHT